MDCEAVICDAHVHVGCFSGGLDFSPQDVAHCMQENKIDQFLFFSTAQVGDYESSYQIFLRHWAMLDELCPAQALPALWMSAEAFGQAKHYIRTGIRALKFHPQVERCVTDHVYDRVIAIAGEWGLPLIIHTSYDDACSCTRIARVAERRSETPLILAHGRPFEDCPSVLGIDHVYADTAYMPLAEMKKIIDAGFGHKLLFGSDYPIDRYYYPDECAETRYQRLIRTLRDTIDSDKILYGNFHRLFKSRNTEQ